MDNITFEKIWQDDNIIELKISANNDFVSANQTCYIQCIDIEKSINKITEYINKKDTECYIQFGNKKGNYTPAFSMRLLQHDAYGHIKIELDMEIDDNNTRSHRCMFFVTTELGTVEFFQNNMYRLITRDVGIVVSLIS